MELFLQRSAMIEIAYKNALSRCCVGNGTEGRESTTGEYRLWKERRHEMRVTSVWWQ